MSSRTHRLLGRSARPVAAVLLAALGAGPARAQAARSADSAARRRDALRDTLRVALADRRAESAADGRTAGGHPADGHPADEPAPVDSARVLGALRDELTRALAGRWVAVASAPGASADLRVAVLTYAHTNHFPWHYGHVALQVDVAAGAAAGSGTVARGAVRRWDPRANRAPRIVLDAARARAVRHLAAFVDSVRGGALTPPP